jgi:hypothetical protein
MCRLQVSAQFRVACRLGSNLSTSLCQLHNVAVPLDGLHAVAASAAYIAVGIASAPDGAHPAAVHLLHTATGQLLRSLDLGSHYSRLEEPGFTLRFTFDGSSVVVADSLGGARLFCSASGSFVSSVTPPGLTRHLACLEEVSSGWLAVSYFPRKAHVFLR